MPEYAGVPEKPLTFSEIRTNVRRPSRNSSERNDPHVECLQQNAAIQAQRSTGADSVRRSLEKHAFADSYNLWKALLPGFATRRQFGDLPASRPQRAVRAGGKQ